MSNIDKFSFSADRPINSIDDDLLGRAEFAKNLADAINSWDGVDSLVISLYGEWGDGKSSIKNMALSYLEKKKEKPTIIEFSPWEWAAQEKITKAFFDEISKAIGKEDNSEKNKILARKFKKYGAYLSAGEVFLSSASTSLPIILPVLAGVGFLSSLMTDPKSISTFITGVLVIYVSIIKWGADNLKRLAGYYDERAKETEKNLTEIRYELKEELIKRDLPILIVMDDLDRLNTSELRMVFQLIKANTDFPNVTFLLLLQKNIVENKLTDNTQSGKEYLEKIIQVPFSIPKAEISKIHLVLFKNIDSILNSDEKIEKKFDIDRLHEIYKNGLGFYFKNLRDVYRYTSTLKFHFNLLKGKGVFEVNPVDLIAIECIRVFEPNLYNEIYRNKKAFTSFSGASYDNGWEKKKLQDTIYSAIEKSDVRNKDIVEEILKNIFPNIQSIISNIYYDYSRYSIWFAEGRICHEKNFEQYFMLSLEGVEITKSDLEEFIELAKNKEHLKSKIFELDGRGILAEFLGQFEAFSNRVHVDSAIPYLSSLIEVADLVNKELGESFDLFSSQTYIYRLVYFFLERIENKKSRGEIILECFSNNDDSLIVAAKLLISEERDQSEKVETLLNHNDYISVKENFLKKIRYMSHNNPNKFIYKKSFLMLLYRWKDWGGEGEVIEWVSSQIKNKDGLIKILNAMVETSTSYVSGKYTPQINYYIRGSVIKDFIGMDKIEKLIENIDISLLDETEKKLIALTKRGIEKEKGGEGDFFR